MRKMTTATMFGTSAIIFWLGSALAQSHQANATPVAPTDYFVEANTNVLQSPPQLEQLVGQSRRASIPQPQFIMCQLPTVTIPRVVPSSR